MCSFDENRGEVKMDDFLNLIANCCLLFSFGKKKEVNTSITALKYKPLVNMGVCEPKTDKKGPSAK